MSQCLEHGREQTQRADGTYACSDCWEFHKRAVCLCNQHDCTNKGVFRFTWPGRDEQYICEQHVATLQNIAGAMGLHLQVIPL